MHTYILNFFFNTLYYTLHYLFYIINTFFNLTFLMSGVSKRKSGEGIDGDRDQQGKIETE